MSAAPARHGLSGCIGDRSRVGPGGCLRPDLGRRPGHRAASGAPRPTPGAAPRRRCPRPRRPPGRSPAAPAASSRFVRLNHRQWENTVRDLLKLQQPSGLSAPVRQRGRPHQLRHPRRRAGDLRPALAGLQQGRRHPGQPGGPRRRQAERPDAGQRPRRARGARPGLHHQLRPRAFRRPLTDAEVGQYLELFRKGPEMVGTGNALADGLELVITGFLNSPHLLYRTELSETVASGKIALSDYEVASRLSYGLTNTHARRPAVRRRRGQAAAHPRPGPGPGPPPAGVAGRQGHRARPARPDDQGRRPDRAGARRQAAPPVQAGHRRRHEGRGAGLRERGHLQPGQDASPSC